MKIQLNKIKLLSIMTLLFLSGCTQDSSTNNLDDQKINVVTTTTLSKDLVKVIGGEYVDVIGLMGPGVDPHLYQASAGDVTKMQNAQIVVYHGLHLEGKMGDVFSQLETLNIDTICLEDGLNKQQLLMDEDDNSQYDPHIWFDVSLWKQAANHVSEQLSKIDNVHADYYQENLIQYLSELDDLNNYIYQRIDEIDSSHRVLVTAHDAFSYFGKAYGMEVKGLQGISTESEAATSDVSALATFIADNKIKAIFIESSVPTKTITALQDAVIAQGFNVEIGGELFSDALGDENSGADTYITMVKANVDTIVNALK